MSSKNSSAFGRDEMNALLGSGSSGGVVQESVDKADPLFRPSSKRSTVKDVADMTPQEAAEHLRTQKAKQQQSGRHRTNKVRQYHQLLVEQRPIQNKDNDKDDNEVNNRNSRYDDSSSDEADTKKPTAPLRPRAAPVILGKRRRRYDSSSSSDDESVVRKESKRTAKDRDDDSSSSSSDDEADQRRKRLLQKRQQEKLSNEQTKDDSIKMVVEDSIQRDEKPITDTLQDSMGNGGGNILKDTRTEATVISRSATKKQKSPVDESDASSGGDSSQASSSSDNDDSDSDDTSSSDDSVQVSAPPKLKFVPKHKRLQLQAETKKEEATQQIIEQTLAVKEKLQLESRTLVQQQVLEQQRQLQDADNSSSATEVIPGARNVPPVDNDDDDEDAARDAWEIREIERLLADLDASEQLEQEVRELERRRNMTDKERMEEDAALGRYKQSGDRRVIQDDSSGVKRGQKFFHKGAFYMDDTEWDASDVRHKATDYAQAATGDDKVNKAILPKVMQVKKFGFANQNRKYKGLAAEDTTDKRMDVLPLDYGKKKRQKDL